MLLSVYLLHPFHRFDLLYQRFQFGIVVYGHCQHAREQSVVRVDADGAQQDVVLLINNRRDVRHDADVVMTDNTEGNRILFTLALSGPAGFHDAVREAGTHLLGIRAVTTVNFDTAVDADESEHFITVNRVTAFGQCKVESFQVPVDDQHVILVILCVGGLLHVEAFRTAVADFFALLGFPLLHVKVLVARYLSMMSFTSIDSLAIL